VVGAVTDSTGAAVPGATVKVTEKGTNDTRESSRNDAGGYTLSTVLAGTYEISVSKPGFRTALSNSVTVSLNSVVRFDTVLQLGTHAETVQVTAESAPLQTDRADVRGEFNSVSLENLPLPTRAYQGVIALMPGNTLPIANAGGINNPSRSMQFSSNGTSRIGSNVRVEGISATNSWVQFYSSLVPSMEAIQTVNIVMASADAEQGLGNGAQ